MTLPPSPAALAALLTEAKFVVLSHEQSGECASCSAEICRTASHEALCWVGKLKSASLAVEASSAIPSPVTEFSTFASLVREEVERACGKYPDTDILVRLAALTGEVGELAEGVLKRESPNDLYREAVQVAACAYRVAYTLARNGRPVLAIPSPTPEPSLEIARLRVLSRQREMRETPHLFVPDSHSYCVTCDGERGDKVHPAGAAPPEGP